MEDSASMVLVETAGGTQTNSNATTLSSSPAGTLVIINRFVLETSSFLNRFAAHAETQLRDLSVKVKKLECNLEILEAKLNSIPGLTEDSTDTPSNEEPAQILDGPPAVVIVKNNSKTNVNDVADAVTADTDPSNGAAKWQTIEQNIGPQYNKYIKLCKMGMPLDSIKLKAEAEGVDPSPLNILELVHGKGTGVSLGDTDDTKTVPPEIQIYYKMLKMGVPVDNVRQKMVIEGHDPKLLQVQKP